MHTKKIIIVSVVSMLTLQFAAVNAFAETNGEVNTNPKPTRGFEKVQRVEQKVEHKTEMLQNKLERPDKASQSARFAVSQKQILTTANRLQAVTTKLETFVAELETKISQAQTAGQDVTKLTPLLTDMKAKLASSKTQAQSAITAVTPLTADGFPANKTTLMSARDSLRTGDKDLMAALKDAKQIVKGLHRDSQKSPTSPPTTTP